MPTTSEQQRRAMFAAAEGRSTLGIPQKVGAEFTAADATGGLAAGVIFVAPDGDVLFLRRSDVEEHFSGHWALPGGKADPGEDAAAAARREAREEIGREPGDMRLVDSRLTPSRMAFHTFAAAAPEKFTPVLNEEHDAFRWAPFDELPEPLHPGVSATLRDRLGVTRALSSDEAQDLGRNFARWAQNGDGAVSQAADATWEETKHPRRDDGKFGSGSGSSAAPAAKPEAKTETPNAAPDAAASASQATSGSGNPRVAAASLYQKSQPTPLTPERVKADAERIAEKAGATKRIAEARKKLETIVPTDKPVSEGGFLQSDGTYTPERQQIHEKLLAEIFSPQALARAKPPEGEKPTMTLLGGRGGSGKSWLTGDDGPVDASKTIVVDADHFKSRLPGYEGWNAAQFHEESSYLVDEAARMASEAGVNVVFDATLKSSKSANVRIQQFQTAGYEIDGYYMFASPQTATERAMNRFMRGGETGRFVPPEVIMGNTENEKNFDNAIQHFRKWGVYDNDSGGGPKHVAGHDKPDGNDRAMDAQISESSIALDRASVRRVDEDGHLHVSLTPISKANICPYFGREIPGFARLGLDPDRVYKLLRDPKELEKAAETFAGKPLLMDHKPVSADDHPKQRTVGSIGNQVVWKSPYLMAPLSVWDGDAIRGIQNDTQRELSSAYRYDADMTPGTFEGEPYDGVMRNIRGNHVALVREGRAGPDVIVGDSALKRFNFAAFALDESPAEKARAEGKFTERDTATASANAEHRDAMPASAFLEPGSRKYPVKEKRDGQWVYDRNLLLAAARDARMNSDNELAARADAIRKREFGTAQDHKPKEGQMAKSMLSRKAILVQGALMTHLAPRLAQDAKIDLPSVLSGVTAKNYSAQKAGIVSRLTKATAGKLAQDADLDDITQLLDALEKVEPAEDDLEPNPDDPMMMRGAADDEDEEAKRLAEEEEAKKKAESEKAMDAAINKAVIAERQRAEGVAAAREEVFPKVGKIAVACDTAADVYGHALTMLGVDTKDVEPSAMRGMYRALAAAPKAKPVVAQDAKASSEFAEMFPNAGRLAR